MGIRWQWRFSFFIVIMGQLGKDHLSRCFPISMLTGVNCSIRVLAETMADAVGFKGRVSFDASKSDGSPRKLLDVSGLWQLGWEASTSLRQGLEQTYRWFEVNSEKAKGGGR
jgi:GDP-L-fucose synthase